MPKFIYHKLFTQQICATGKKMLGENLCYALLFMVKLKKKEEYDAYKVIAVPNKLLYRISKNKLHRILHINVNK